MTVRPIILAAGVGKRMRSSLPKVLHRICGRPMIRYVLAAVNEVGLARPVVVVGRGAEAVQVEVGDGATFVVQPEQKGTAHAVLVGLEAAPDGEAVLVLYGDVPLLTGRTLERLVAQYRDARPGVTLLTASLPDPAGYGRIVRGTGGPVTPLGEGAATSPGGRGCATG